MYMTTSAMRNVMLQVADIKDTTKEQALWITGTFTKIHATQHVTTATLQDQLFTHIPNMLALNFAFGVVKRGLPELLTLTVTRWKTVNLLRVQMLVMTLVMFAVKSAKLLTFIRSFALLLVEYVIRQIRIAMRYTLGTMFAILTVTTTVAL
jgi:hypothetical protein